MASRAAVVLVYYGAAASPSAAEDSGAVRVLPVAASRFMQSNNTASFIIEQGGLGRLCTVKGGGYFVASVQLPDGARIERITAMVEDASEEAFAMVSLARSTEDGFTILATTPVSSGMRAIDPPEKLTTDRIREPVIDSGRYSYFLQVMLSGPAVCLRGAQVQYRAS
jgi:hypothetical protein